MRCEAVMEINRPDVLEEVTAVFLGYERALTANDVGALTGRMRVGGAPTTLTGPGRGRS